MENNNKDMTTVRKIIKALCLDTNTKDTYVIVKVGFHIVAEGTAEEVFNATSLNLNHIVISVTPDYTIRDNPEFAETPVYKLSKIIECM